MVTKLLVSVYRHCVTCEFWRRKSNLPKPTKNTPNAKDDSHTYHPSGLVNPRTAHPIPALIRTADSPPGRTN
jgi:hypothetical protein